MNTGMGPQLVNINHYYMMGGGAPGLGAPGMGFPGTAAAGLGGFGMTLPQPSAMDQFMYGVNSQVAMATAGPNGGSVIDWANSLAAGQQAQGQPQASGAGGGIELVKKIIGMFMQVIMAKLQGQAA